jgi:predicted RNase H-like nuclease (RuvC/YqgF family)
MQHRPIISSAIALLTTIGMLASTGAQAGMYRYEDENGRMVISNTIPQEATRRGYDILGNNGRVVETVPPAPTAEEIAAREAEKERQRQAEIQSQKDKELLERYSHPDQAVRAMHRKVREMEGMIQLKRGNISVISSQLNNEQSRAADMERAGREVPEASLEKIRRLEAQIDDVEQEIQNQRRQIEEMKDEFKADIKRLEEVTGEQRTLPLEPPENDSP